MGRSPRFASTTTDYVRPIQTRFRYGSARRFALPVTVTSRLIMQKARGRALFRRTIALPLLVDTRFQVLFHSPNRGTFHLSLTVLVRYRSQSSM